MATTLSNGYVLPVSGDRGSVWFPALETNIQRLNDHTHNGTDSNRIDSAAIDGVEQTLLAASWLSVGNGLYRQLVTMASPLTFDLKDISAVINSGADVGKRFYPTLEKVSSNTFYIYINDNSVDVKVLYT